LLPIRYQNFEEVPGRCLCVFYLGCLTGCSPANTREVCQYGQIEAASTVPMI